MSNWGATDADESKPKYLTAAQKKEVYANASGWVVEAGSTMTGNGRTGADPDFLDVLHRFHLPRRRAERMARPPHEEQLT